MFAVYAFLCEGGRRELISNTIYVGIAARLDIVIRGGQLREITLSINVKQILYIINSIHTYTKNLS